MDRSLQSLGTQDFHGGSRLGSDHINTVVDFQYPAPRQPVIEPFEFGKDGNIGSHVLRHEMISANDLDTALLCKFDNRKVWRIVILNVNDIRLEILESLSNLPPEIKRGIHIFVDKFQAD